MHFFFFTGDQGRLHPDGGIKQNPEVDRGSHRVRGMV